MYGSPIKTESELLGEARSRVAGGLVSDLAQGVGGKVTAEEIADCVLELLYDNIEFEITDKVFKKLEKDMEYYC